MRELKLSRTAAVFAALAAGLMAYSFALTRNPTLPATAAWLPLSLFLQLKINSQVKDIAQLASQITFRTTAALSISMVVAAGRPEVFLPGIAILFAMPILYRYCSFALKSEVSDLCNSRKSAKEAEQKKLIWQLLVTGFGVGIAMPVILPALEWASLSSRAHGLSFEQIFAWSANWYDFASIAFSFPLGDVYNLSQKGPLLESLVHAKSGAIPFMSSNYLGPIVLSLAFCAFTSKSWRLRKLAIGAMAGSILLAAGSNTILGSSLFSMLPFFSMLRFPVKFLIFTAIILSFSAAYGFDLLLRKNVSERSLKLAGAIWILPLVLSALIFLSTSFQIIGWQYAKSSPDLIREANLSIAQSMLAASLIGIAFSVSALMYLKDKLQRTHFAIGVLLTLSLSLFCSAKSFPYFTQAGFYTEQSKLFKHLNSFLSEGEQKTGIRNRILPFYTDGLLLPSEFKKGSTLSFEEKFHAYSRNIGRGNSTLDFEIPQAFGYEAALPDYYSQFFFKAREYSSQYLTGEEHRKPVSDIPIWRFCRLTGTKYLLTQEALVIASLPLPQLDDRYFDLFGQSSGNNSRIYKVIDSWPRLYFADSVEILKSWDEFEEKILNPEPSENDSKRICYMLDSSSRFASVKELLARIRSKNSEKTGRNKAGFNHKPEFKKFKIECDNGQFLSISIDTSKPEFLVLSDQNYPGWKAYLDGEEQAIISVNLFARALALPEGHHLLEFRYEPASVFAGFICMFFSFTLLISGSLVDTLYCKNKIPDHD